MPSRHKLFDLSCVFTQPYEAAVIYNCVKAECVNQPGVVLKLIARCSMISKGLRVPYILAA